MSHKKNLSIIFTKKIIVLKMLSHKQKVWRVVTWASSWEVSPSLESRVIFALFFWQLCMFEDLVLTRKLFYKRLSNKKGNLGNK